MKKVYSDTIKTVYMKDSGILWTVFNDRRLPDYDNCIDKYHNWHAVQNMDYMIKLSKKGEFIFINPTHDEENTRMVEELIRLAEYLELDTIKCGRLPESMEEKMIRDFGFKSCDCKKTLIRKF